MHSTAQIFRIFLRIHTVKWDACNLRSTDPEVVLLLLLLLVFIYGELLQIRRNAFRSPLSVHSLFPFPFPLFY